MTRLSCFLWITLAGFGPSLAQLESDEWILVQEHRPLRALKATLGPARILWDTSHGVFLDYEPSGRYSSLTSLLAAKGQLIEASDVGVLNLDLRQYTALVICLGSNFFQPYTDEEATQIHEYVRNGGNLLITSDNYGSPHANFANVAAGFGVTFTERPLFPGILFLEHFSSHTIAAGISQLYINSGGDHLISPPMEAVAWAADGEIVVSAGQFGGGHVVVTGDSDMFTNGALLIADNQRFAENVFDALTVLTVPTLGTPYLFVYVIGLVAALCAARYRKH